MYCVGLLKSYTLITSDSLKSEARLLTGLYGSVIYVAVHVLHYKGVDSKNDLN